LLGAIARAELRERLARAESARESALSTLAIEKAAAESVRMAEVAAKEELIGDLREQLAWHRRPWWRRWRG
jgi:hypothetical protein